MASMLALMCITLATALFTYLFLVAFGDRGIVVVKFTILLKRNPAMTHAEFVQHHRQVHAPLFMSVAAVQANVRQYVQQHALPVDMSGLSLVEFDGATELWFDDAAAIGAVFEDAEYLERIRPDEERFLDLHGCRFRVSDAFAVTG